MRKEGEQQSVEEATNPPYRVMFTLLATEECPNERHAAPAIVLVALVPP